MLNTQILNWNTQDQSDVLGYHIDCYRKFTTLGKAEELKKLLSHKQETTKVTTCWSNSNTHIVSLQTGIFQGKCIFCKQSKKKVKKQKQKLIQVLTTQIESKIKEYTRPLSDKQIMRDLQNEDRILLVKKLSTIVCRGLSIKTSLNVLERNQQSLLTQWSNISAKKTIVMHLRSCAW